jgi:DNA-binding NtrC family response regulator
MREAHKLLRLVAGKDVIVTLIGESGAGKEVLARRIHALSKRAAGPFIPINCAAIPEQLFESEMFGHERGAFTGATDRARGKIEAARGGTLFLDEIAEMPIGTQTKLLRFLETRKFMRVGGSTKIDADVRVLCATLRPLDQEMRAGRFRGDLFYRVQGVALRVPPLRERRADIGPLVRELVDELCSKHGTLKPTITRPAMQALRGYHWPGNVRELRYVLELVCILREGRRVRLSDLPAPLLAAPMRTFDDTHLEADSSTSIAVHLDRPLAESIDAIMNAALVLEHGNRSRAARRLGVSLRTMQRFANRSVAVRRSDEGLLSPVM